MRIAAAPVNGADFVARPYARKSLGQNFLVDSSVVSKIVDSLNIQNADTIIEIGPGRGALTERLAEKAARVVAIELDRDLIPFLNEKFIGSDNFEIVERDALMMDFEELAAGKTAKLVANLPYYISTAILQRLIEQRDVFSEMVLMFQREVVDRITAPPGSSERGFLTVMVEAFLKTEKLFDVPPAAFHPAPKVWSSVVRLRPNDGPVPDERLLREIASVAFGQKRKTILNNLKKNYPNADQLLLGAGIDSKRRAETLTMNEWISLVDAVNNNRAQPDAAL